MEIWVKIVAIVSTKLTFFHLDKIPYIVIAHVDTETQCEVPCRSYDTCIVTGISIFTIYFI